MKVSTNHYLSCKKQNHKVVKGKLTKDQLVLKISINTFKEIAVKHQTQMNLIFFVLVDKVE